MTPAVPADVEIEYMLTVLRRLEVAPLRGPAAETAQLRQAAAQLSSGLDAYLQWPLVTRQEMGGAVLERARPLLMSVLALAQEMEAPLSSLRRDSPSGLA